MKDELSLLQAQMTYKKRLEAMLKELQAQRDPLRQKVDRLEKDMRSQRKDVDRLEGRSLAGFFYIAMGRMEEKLDIERREYYAAKVKYEAAARELSAIEEDIANTEEDLADLADCESRYAQALEAKRHTIETAGTDLSGSLLRKEQELTNLHSQERELEEAITAGTTVLRTASDVVNSLRSVENLSYLDRFGKNALADMARHETWDDTQKLVEELQVRLQQFNKELLDVTIRETMQASIDRMLKFSDSFFESLLTETPGREELESARTQVNHATDLILGILRQLQTKLEEVRHTYLKVQQDVDSLILSIEV